MCPRGVMLIKHNQFPIISSTGLKIHLNILKKYSHDTAQGPYVRFTAMPLFVKDFWGKVIWCATDRSEIE